MCKEDNFWTKTRLKLDTPYKIAAYYFLFGIFIGVCIMMVTLK